MKFPQDTTQNKVSSTLLPAVFAQTGESLAKQSKRGFAESLRHQISVVAETSRQVVKTDKAQAVRQSEPDKAERNTRGTDLPVREQNLPRDSHASAAKDTAGTDNHSGPAEQTETAAITNNSTSAADARQDRVLAERSVKETETETVSAQSAEGSVPANITVEPDAAAADNSTVAEGEATDAQSNVSDIQTPMAVPVTVETSALNVTSLPNWAADAPADPLKNGLWTHSVTATPASMAISDTARNALPTSDAEDLISTTVAPFLAAMSGSVPAFAGKASELTPGLSSESADEAMPLSPLSLNPSSVRTTDAGSAYPGLLQPGQQNMPAQNPDTLQSALTQTRSQSGPQTTLSENAMTGDLFDTMLQADLDAGDTAAGDMSFSEKLLNQKPALPASLQYASMLSQSGLQQSAAYGDMPLNNALMQGLMAGQQLVTTGSDTASVPTLTAGAGSSLATGSASGLSATLYSQEQRQQAAIEARNVQAQSSRGVDTSLATTSALKLPGLDVTFGQAGWADRIGRQMLLQSAQGSSSAQIRLDPPELGSLTVKIQLIDQTAAVNFVSPHAMVRDALEQQAGRLQEMFREQGLDLSDVSVSDQSSNSDGGEQRNSSGTGNGPAAWLAEDGTAPASVARQSESLIDYYA